MKNDIQAQWDEIYQAIDEDNGDLLYILFFHQSIYTTSKKNIDHTIPGGLDA
jgi:hypothetical protein